MEEYFNQICVFVTGIDVDIEVRTRNKDEKAGDAKNKTDNTKDGKNNVSGEEQTNAMEVDEKHQKEASASAPRAERESTESEGWTVVNQDTTQQGMHLHLSSYLSCLEYLGRTEFAVLEHHYYCSSRFISICDKTECLIHFCI